MFKSNAIVEQSNSSSGHPFRLISTLELVMKNYFHLILSLNERTLLSKQE